MDTGMLHLHHMLVGIFVLLLAAKLLLMLLRLKGLLATLNGRTRVVNAVVGALLLATGAYLAYKSPVGTAPWALVKYAAVLVGIPLGLVGVRRLNPGLTVASLVLFIYSYGVARTQSYMLQGREARMRQAVTREAGPSGVRPGNYKAVGIALYREGCLPCHGKNGDAQYRKSGNLKLVAKQRVYVESVVKNGKGAMPAFPFLSDEELNAISLYVARFHRTEGAE